MISTENVSLQYGKRVLFDEVNVKFSGSNCFGVIGANGAGKSTFLKILSGVIEPNNGSVSLEKGKRMAVLNQDHYVFDEVPVINTVMMGHKILWELMERISGLRSAIRASILFSSMYSNCSKLWYPESAV